MDLVSVVVPIFNVEKVLRRCVDSIIAQTYKNLEIILVEDGSPDKCALICDEYLQKDNRIQVIHQTNKGLSAARNAGINLSNGNFIIFVDSDDVLEKSAIKTWIKIQKITNADIVVGGYRKFIDLDSAITEHNTSKEYLILGQEQYWRYILNNESYCTAWGKLYTAKIFTKLKFDESKKYAEDMWILPDIISKCNVFAIIPYEGYFYNQEGESLVRSKYNNNKFLRIDAAELWSKRCSSLFPSLEKLSAKYYLTVLVNECLMALKSGYSLSNYKILFYRKKAKKMIHTGLLSLSVKERIKYILFVFTDSKIYILKELIKC